MRFLSRFNRDKKEGWKIIIASEDEPGERMIVSGTIFSSDGKPLKGITVHVYHTDAQGYYSIDGEMNKHRLKGTMITNAEGKYEYEPIKPAPYPNRAFPAHVHYKITGDNISEQWFELQFEGDPLFLIPIGSGIKMNPKKEALHRYKN